MYLFERETVTFYYACQRARIKRITYSHSHNLRATLVFSAKSEAVFSKPFHKTSINTGEREYGPDHRRLLLPIFCDAKFIHCKPRGGGSALGPFTSAHCPPRPPPPTVPSRPSLRQAPAPSRDEMTASTTLVTRAAEVNFAACTILFCLCPSVRAMRGWNFRHAFLLKIIFSLFLLIPCRTCIRLEPGNAQVHESRRPRLVA